MYLSSPPSSPHSPSSLSFIPAVTCVSHVPPPPTSLSLAFYSLFFPPAPHVLHLNLFTLISHLCCEVPSRPLLPNHQFFRLLSWSLSLLTFLFFPSRDRRLTLSSSFKLAIPPLPSASILHFRHFSVVSPSVHPHSSLIPAEWSCCLHVCVCFWKIIWKLAACLSSEGTSAFYPLLRLSA